jgi:hypothetical protein
MLLLGILVNQKKKGQGKQRGHFPKKRDANGNLVVAISHTDTGWYRSYVKWPPTTHKQSLRFLKYGMLLVLTVLDKSRHLSNF